MTLAVRTALVLLSFSVLTPPSLCVLVQMGRMGQTVRLVLDPTLQSQAAVATTSRIANASLSPWSYRESCDASRFPRQVFHAQCLTSGCLSPEGGGEDFALEAKPIYYQALVLHKVRQRTGGRTSGGRKRRNYVLQLGTEIITVGCTCVRPNMVPQRDV